MSLLSLSASEQLALVKLHAEQIETQLDSQAFESLRGLIQRSSRTDLERQFKNGISRELQKRFMNELLSSPLNMQLFPKLLQYFANTQDPTLHSKLLARDVLDAPKYGKCLSNLDLIISVRDSGLLLNCLLSTDAAYAPLCSKILTINDPKAAMCELLKEIPYTCSQWYWDLFRAISQVDSRLVDRIHPNFDIEYGIEKQLFHMTQDNIFAIGVNDPLDLENAHKIDLAKSHLSFRNTPVYYDSVPVQKLHLRPYQEELATAALQGKNTIISAPTGSGKTIVAVKIIEQHLMERQRDRKKCKVVFVVPTVPLVHQQCLIVKTYLGDRWNIRECMGGEANTPKTMIAKNCDVVVMTPQLLVNLMNVEDQADRLDMCDISLLLFDECHHTTEKHPYNVVMQEYQDRRATNNVGGSLPQVIGLTASLGVGESETITDAVDYIVLMAANMCAAKLSSVIHNLESLHRFVNAPLDEVERIASTHTREPFYQIVAGIMKRIEDDLLPYFHILRATKKLDVPEPPQPRHLQKYEGWFSNLLQNDIPRLQWDSDKIRNIISSLEHIKIYNKALELHAHLPSERAFEFLDDKIPSFCAQSKTTEWDRHLLRLFTDAKPQLSQSVARSSNDLWNRLCQILIDQYLIVEDSRTIVFVRTRELTMALKDFVNKHDVLQDLGVRAGFLTSINTSKDEGGQAQSVQREELVKFRAGDIKVMFATTVAEEGLDIEQCNLVVKYNHATNEIALMQRRGRGRAEGSRSILLAQEDWIAEKEQINREREKLMNEALARIRKIEDARFAGFVEAKTKELVEERMLQRALEDKKKQRMAGNAQRFRLLCKKCQRLICPATCVRLVQSAHFVCVDPSVWCLVRPSPLPDPKLFATMCLIGETKCSACSHKWGTVIKFKNVFLPTLAANSFVLQRLGVDGRPERDQQLITVKQWKKVTESHFNVWPVEDYDLAAMKDAFKKFHESMAEKYDKNIAIRRSLMDDVGDE